MKSFLLRIRLYIRSYFGFSLKETNGFLILSILMAVFLLAPLAFEQFYPNKDSDYTQDRKILDSLLAVIENNKTSTYENHYSKNDSYNPDKKNYTPSAKQVISLFTFDPNTTPLEDLIKLGIRPNMAERIEKYRSKGGKFRQKEDLMRIYGFPEELYQKLEPFIQIVESKTENKYPAQENVASKKEKLINNTSCTFSKYDINTADSAQLEKVYGIGAKLASRVIKFRNKLGGFINMNQLEEIYGLDSSVIKELNKKYEVSNNFVPLKININLADVENLKKHPYIGYKFARIIVSFRQQHGNYYGAEQLKEIKILTEQDIEKMKPYIEF